MSVFESNRAVPLGAVTIHRAVSLAERAVDAVRARWEARATERALSKLTDKALDDIGLHRGAIAEVARDLARR